MEKYIFRLGDTIKTLHFYRLTAAVFAAALLFSSCSLKYGMTIQSEENVPEFVFQDVQFDRYEDGSKTLGLKAEKLEQYKDGKSMYAKDMEFELYNNSSEVTNSGKCGYLSADTKNERYVLYNGIEIENVKDGLTVKADNLKWNGKSEQLTSSRNDVVTIKKGDTVLQGSGFSASALSKKFVFHGVVTGYTDTEDSSKDSDSEAGSDGVSGEASAGAGAAPSGAASASSSDGVKNAGN